MNPPVRKELAKWVQARGRFFGLLLVVSVLCEWALAISVFQLRHQLVSEREAHTLATARHQEDLDALQAKVRQLAPLAEVCPAWFYTTHTDVCGKHP